MEPPWKLLAHPGLGGSAPSTRGWGRSQVSEIWILVTADYINRGLRRPARPQGGGWGQQLGAAALGVDDQRRMLA